MSTTRPYEHPVDQIIHACASGKYDSEPQGCDTSSTTPNPYRLVNNNLILPALKGELGGFSIGFLSFQRAQ